MEEGAIDAPLDLKEVEVPVIMEAMVAEVDLEDEDPFFDHDFFLDEKFSNVFQRNGVSKTHLTCPKMSTLA